MLQYKTLLAESRRHHCLLAQKEIASLQKELDSFRRKAVDAKAKEKDAMERAAKFAKAETEKVAVSVLVRAATMACRATSTSMPRRPGDTHAIAAITRGRRRAYGHASARDRIGRRTRRQTPR